MTEKKKKKLLREFEDEFIPDPDCRLITPYTRYKGISDKLLKRLQEVRLHDPETGPIEIKYGSKYKKDQFPLKNYQTQQVAHMTSMPRLIVGDAVGLGKTICAIAASCLLHDRIENFKVIVLTTRSTTYQWASEFQKFSDLRTWVLKDQYKDLKTEEARLVQINQFLKGVKKDVLIAKYTSLIGTREYIKIFDQNGVEVSHADAVNRNELFYDKDGNPVTPGTKQTKSSMISNLIKILQENGDRVLLILDEAQKFKSEKTSIRTLVESISPLCNRVVAMTATAIKNKLDEFYSIAFAIGIRPFRNVDWFKNKFCVMRRKKIGKFRWTSEITGYKDIPEFREGMRPWFYGRSQIQVKEKLPKLATTFHPFKLNAKESKLLLHDIPNGDYILPPKILKEAGEIVDVKERSFDNLMTAMSVYQLVANSSALLEPDNPTIYYSNKLSSKEEELLDLLDGELSGEKVIVFTKYRTWIDRLEYLNSKGQFSERKFLRITGAENEVKREKNRRLFQEDPEHDLIFINSAGIEGINLQQAAHMIVLDAPWSWGDMLQLVGRMVRMSSPNSACTLHMLLAEGTIDEYVIETLRSKKGVFEKILGETYSAGVLDDGTELLDIDSGLDKCGSDDEFFDMLKSHVKTTSMRNFINGQILSDVKSGKRKENVVTKIKRTKREKKEFNMDLWDTESSKALEKKVLSSGGLGLIDDDD